MEFVNEHPDKPWEWYALSRNRNITIEIIEKYSDKPWDWEGISQNTHITAAFVIKYMGLERIVSE